MDECTEKQTESVTGTYVKDTDATCTQAETGHYEASFTNTAFEKQQTAAGSVTKGDAPGHAFGNWETVKEPTAEEEGRQTKRCLVCGVLLDTLKLEKLAKENAEGEEIIFLSRDGLSVRQVLTTLFAEDGTPDTLVITVDGDEELLQSEELELTFGVKELDQLAANSYERIILKSACGMLQVEMELSDLQNILALTGADRLVVAVTDAVPPEDGNALILPEGMTAASPLSHVSVTALRNHEPVTFDDALLERFRLGMLGAAPLADIGNDMVGLFCEELNDFTVLPAEYIFNEEENEGYWQIPMVSDGSYMMAEKTAE